MSEPLTVYDVLEEMRRLADDARPVFFNSSKVGIEKTELSKLIKRIEQVLPDDIRKAKTVLETRDDILEKCREESEKALSTAQADAQRMVNNAAATAENTLTRANQQATEQLEDAKTRSNDMLVDAANRANAALVRHDRGRRGESEADGRRQHHHGKRSRPGPAAHRVHPAAPE